MSPFTILLSRANRSLVRILLNAMVICRNAALQVTWCEGFPYSLMSVCHCRPPLRPLCLSQERLVVRKELQAAS